jgi:hypothetical protein
MTTTAVEVAVTRHATPEERELARPSVASMVDE